MMNAMMRVAALCAALAAPQTAAAQVAYYWWWETWPVQPGYVMEYYPPPVIYYAPPVYVPTCWVENWWNGWCWQVRHVCQ